jgi:hypothetical protein
VAEAAHDRRLPTTSACRHPERRRALAGNAVGLDIAFVSPIAYVAVALVGTVVLALARLAPRGPLQPGEPLRYA